MPDAHGAERGETKRLEREAAVRAQQAAAVRAERRRNTVKHGAILLLSTGLAWTVYSNGRLAQKAASRDTVYAVLQANGEFIASTHYDEIPSAATQEQAIQNALWTYVQAADCYGSSDVIRQYYILLAMSDQAVGKQVKDKFNLANPDAPQHVYGEHGITVHCDLMDPPTPIGTMANPPYFFRFRRWETSARDIGFVDPSTAPVYTVTVRFLTGVYPADDKRRAWLDRTTFNAPGVQVIHYPGAQPTNTLAKKGP